MRDALLLELDLHQCVALLLKGRGKLLGLLSLLLSLSKTGSHLLECLALMLSLSLHLDEGCVLQREVVLSIAEHCALSLKLLLFLQQYDTELLGLFGLLLHRDPFGVAILLCVEQGTSRWRVFTCSSYSCER
jgi:hypothetical protein